MAHPELWEACDSDAQASSGPMTCEARFETSKRSSVGLLKSLVLEPGALGLKDF